MNLLSLKNVMARVLNCFLEKQQLQTYNAMITGVGIFEINWKDAKLIHIPYR